MNECDVAAIIAGVLTAVGFIGWNLSAKEAKGLRQSNDALWRILKRQKEEA